MKTILVIEDDTIISDFYFELLSHYGYTVYLAFDGQKALNLLHTQKFDVAILDMSIPCIHGRSLLFHIKKISKNLPIIISTGKIGMEDDPEIKLSGQVKKFLLKPVLPEQLLQNIQQVIQENMHKNLEGRNFAGCYLEKFIESGSSGAVYRATKGKCLVAVKVLTLRSESKNITPPSESAILYRLKHPNIINIHDMGVEDQMPFLVMEYFEGESLYKIVQKQGLIALSEAISILIQVASGMIVSHECNLIHRDLKPSNILYSRQENLAKIIDFGTAKELSKQESTTYEVIGSPYYMSPEQCQGFALDIRTDIYSLGVTFFHIITGTVPYSRCNTRQTMLAHIQEPLTWPKKVGQCIPNEIRLIIERMLAKNKEDRFHSMQELIQHIYDVMKLTQTSRCIPKNKF